MRATGACGHMAASRKRLSNKAIADEVAAVLARHIGPHARLTLALSGGLDSVALLHLLHALQKDLAFTLRVVHVHHGLSPNADRWADACGRLCDALALDLAVHRVAIAVADPAGVEAAARRERQRVFAGLDTDFLLTAHHQDDQAETFLLQALRGAGPKGLAAMAECRRPPGWRAAQLRPLLGLARRDLLDYAQTRGLTWVDDESNSDLRYRRNALRCRVLPVLMPHFPGAVATLARVAALQADAAGLLDELARLDGAPAIDGERLDCARLAALPAARARNLLRYFIEREGQALPGARRLGEALHQLLDARDDARVQVDLGVAELRRFRGYGYVVVAAPPPVPQVWQGEERLNAPGWGSLHLLAAPGQGLLRRRLPPGRLLLTTRTGGERLRLLPGGPTRSLKNLMQERAMPPWFRARLPLLKIDGTLVWAAGFGCHADWLAPAGESGLMPAWRPASD